MSAIFVRKVYRVPMLIAFTTLAGLLFALFGDGPWDRLSWTFLAVPIAVIIYKYARPSKSSGLT